jgi:hypothetical protein
VTATQRFQRVTDLHGRILLLSKGRFDGRMRQKGVYPASGNPQGRAGF